MSPNPAGREDDRLPLGILHLEQSFAEAERVCSALAASSLPHYLSTATCRGLAFALDHFNPDAVLIGGRRPTWMP
jgi:hypothetical protein